MTEKLIKSKKMSVIINGDLFEEIKKVPDDSIDLVLSDPPYRQEAHGRGFAGKREIYQSMSEWTNTENDFYSEDVFKEYIRILKFPNIFLFCGKRDVYRCLDYAEKNELNYFILPLCKKTPTPFTNNTWLSNEFGVHICDRKLTYSTNYRDKIPYFITGNERETSHPNEKNINDVMRVIQNCSCEGQTVFDGFCGSGTTAVACHRLKRDYYCIEKKKEFYEMILKRIDEEEKQLSLL